METTETTTGINDDAGRSIAGAQQIPVATDSYVRPRGPWDRNAEPITVSFWLPKTVAERDEAYRKYVRKHVGGAR